MRRGLVEAFVLVGSLKSGTAGSEVELRELVDRKACENVHSLGVEEEKDCGEIVRSSDQRRRNGD